MRICSKLSGGHKSLFAHGVIAVPSTSFAESLGSGRWIAQAPVCIVIFSGEGLTPHEDCAAAAENMLIASHALGLGACWIANPRASFVARAREFLGAPEPFNFFGMISLGYPDESPAKPKRALADVLHWEEF